MQTINTKYLPATNTRGSRIKATCERGSVTISYPSRLTGGDAHVAAADALVCEFVAQDSKKYGSNKNPWSARRIAGSLPDGSYAHVFVG